MSRPNSSEEQRVVRPDDPAFDLDDGEIPLAIDQQIEREDVRVDVLGGITPGAVVPGVDAPGPARPRIDSVVETGDVPLEIEDVAMDDVAEDNRSVEPADDDPALRVDPVYADLRGFDSDRD
ncbi:hypothetical protein [Chitinimonas koreensis]|uniref:hypothetical protein n=1 Tax=Chitinimonas koreensis TaxID=356302 RepID=UPI0003F71E3D|nr:hypothetical protein [Chitinimonas koreensis]QNM97574.1 hypothetical protein H9L41_04520 [Chitinimonas koreensis]